MSKPEILTLKWGQMKLWMALMGEYGRMGDPIALYRWENIGLKKVPKDPPLIGGYYGWQFEIISKEKLTHAIIKYGLEFQTS